MNESVFCPYCGASNAVCFEPGTTSACWVTDCEVCCRSFEVVAELESGEVVTIEARVA